MAVPPARVPPLPRGPVPAFTSGHEAEPPPATQQLQSQHVPLQYQQPHQLKQSPPLTQLSQIAQSPTAAEAEEASNLFRSVRLKVASRDAEAIRRARWTMIDAATRKTSGTPRDFNTLPRRAAPSLARGPVMDDAGSDFAHPASAPPVPPIPAVPSVSSVSPATTASSPSPATLPNPPTVPNVPQPHSLSTPSMSVPDAQLASLSPGEPSHEPISQFNAGYLIAVVGHDSVGKSTVIRRAIKTWGGSTPVKKYTDDGQIIRSSFAQIKAGGKLSRDCQVEFVEVNLSILDLSGAKPVWPSAMSPVSGVILCYDATRSETLGGLNEALERLCPGIPAVLFACKSDPDKPLEVEAHVGDQIGQPYNVGLIEVTTATTQGKHKMRTGLRWLLYRLEERQRRAEQGRSRISWKKGHHAALSKSELSDHHSSSSSLGWIMDGEGATSTEGSVESEEPTPTDGDPDVTATQETIDVVATVPPPGLSQAEVVATPKPPTELEIYVSLQELFNRLFTAIVSTENDQFVNTFFMVYRRFCQPSELMTEFLERFIEVEQYAVSRDIRLWALMKLSGALNDWATKYPGDLVDLETQALFRKTLGCMLKYTFLAHVTVELVRIEQSLSSAVDVDQSWSCQPVTDEAQLQTPETAAAIELVMDKDVQFADDESVPSAENTPHSKKAVSTRTVSTTSLATSATTSLDAESIPAPKRSEKVFDSSSDISRSLHGADDQGHRKWSSAINALIHMDAHLFALEVSRMQWELFAAIRPRDVFRHDFGKERDEAVGRSIEFFNRLSRFVSTMVLAHPKPKGRARVYEAFVKVAHQLRRLNNYDGLCAVISGLRETSVARLASTHSLVRLEPSLVRDYQSHLRLMDPRGGYVSYRRALQADTTYNHSAIPLLTTILALVNRLQAARPEDRRESDGAVQWDKFARFGEMLQPIPTFQARDSIASGTANASFRRLIEATPVITTEEGLYERSRLVEPTGAPTSSGGGMLRKLANFSL